LNVEKKGTEESPLMTHYVRHINGDPTIAVPDERSGKERRKSTITAELHNVLQHTPGNPPTPSLGIYYFPEGTPASIVYHVKQRPGEDIFKVEWVPCCRILSDRRKQ